MLKVRGLEKSFDGRRVLRGIDLSVAAGESVALLGGNGSGKTTTLSAIVGLAIPDAGEILVAGIDARRNAREARRGLSFLPQKSLFPQTLTVRETLEATARLRRLRSSRVEEELALCELDTMAAQSVATLSGGQRQRLALAVALLPDVPLYLFDEPTANLDPRALTLFLERARALRAQGRCLLFTTHVAADVEVLATRVEVLREGTLERNATEAMFAETEGEVRVEVRGDAARWVAAARELGARDARAVGSRLFICAPRSLRISIVAGLERQGLTALDFRTERRWERVLEGVTEKQREETSEAVLDRARASDRGLR